MIHFLTRFELAKLTGNGYAYGTLARFKISLKNIQECTQWKYNISDISINKTDYDFAYLITGVTTNTYLIVDFYNQANDKTTVRFLIRP